MTILHRTLDRSGFSPTTIETYSKAIDRWVAFAGEHPGGWTRYQAQAFYDQLIASGVRANTANLYMAALRYAARWYATQNGRPELDFTVIQLRRPNAKDKLEQRPLTEAEAQALILACGEGRALSPVDLRDRTMIIVALETGMRRKSLHGLHIENLSQEKDQPIAHVPVKGRGGTAMFKVPLSDVAVHAITAWRKQLVKLGVKSGPLFQGFSKRIGPTGRNVYTPTGSLALMTIYNTIVARAEAADIDDMHPHILRHTFVTWRVEAGFSPIEIASITGHSLPREWGQVATYARRAQFSDIRNSTPPWLADLVRRLYG